MNKKGVLTPGTYVLIFVIFVFICATTLFMWPIIQQVTSSEAAYSSGGEKYLFFLIPGVLVVGGLILFFFPNAFGGGQ